MDNKGLSTTGNGLFLAGTGAAVLITRKLLLAPTPRLLLATGAVVWGFYLLGREPYNKTPGWTSIAVGGALALLGGLVSAVSWVAGVGLIAGGLVSFFSGLFGRSDS